MARTICDKPPGAAYDMRTDLELQPGQVFTTCRAFEWFRQNCCSNGLTTSSEQVRIVPV